MDSAYYSSSYSSYSMSSQAPVSRPQQPQQQTKVLSCAECRRSKLRCDRRFPCETCRKRGLEHLCPNDALVTRPNLAADADYLRQENLRLQERVRQLEGALVLIAGFSPEGQSQVDRLIRGDSSHFNPGYGHGHGHGHGHGQ